jgi:hypothetical protein
MRPKLQKQSALKFAGRIIPRVKQSGEQSRAAEVMRPQFQKAKRIEIGWSNYLA